MKKDFDMYNILKPILVVDSPIMISSYPQWGTRPKRIKQRPIWESASSIFMHIGLLVCEMIQEETLSPYIPRSVTLRLKKWKFRTVIPMNPVKWTPITEIVVFLINVNRIRNWFSIIHYLDNKWTLSLHYLQAISYPPYDILINENKLF